MDSLSISSKSIHFQAAVYSMCCQTYVEEAAYLVFRLTDFKFLLKKMKEHTIRLLSDQVNMVFPVLIICDVHSQVF